MRPGKENSVVGISQNDKETCIYTINLKDTPSKKCYSRASAEVTVNRNEVVIREKSQIRVLRNGQELSHNSTTGLKTSFLAQCGLLVVQSAKEAKILSIKGNSFEQLTSVDLAAESSAISCAEDTDGTKFLIVAEQPAASTLKVKSINLSSKSPARVLFDQIVDFSVGKIVEIFADRIGGDYRLIVKTENLQIFSISNDKVNWRREDSLSEIQEVQFFEYQSLEALELNPYFEHLDEHKDSLADLPANFIRRLTAQSTKFAKWANTFIGELKNVDLKNIKEFVGIDADFDRQTGLQKIIIAATRRNTVFGIDSKTGQVLWNKVIDHPWKIVQIYKTKGSHSVKDVLVYLVDESNKNAVLLQ